MLRPVVGRVLDGAAVAPVDDEGGVGIPAWGPNSLLRDLELRLGLPAAETPSVLRLDRWSARLAAILPTEPFYARSYAADPLGTAAVLLMWRDGLVDGGWNGERVAGSERRLETFFALETVEGAPSVAGPADRLARVEHELARRGAKIYDAVSFADDLRAWPARWRRVMSLLELRGTEMRPLRVELPLAPADTDLGLLQEMIRAGRTTATSTDLRGDGSLMVLRAPTAGLAAEAVAALLRANPNGSAGLIRGGEPAILDLALCAQGLPSLGTQTRSRWRAGLQLLPLVMELLFEPPDVFRVLELLTLPVGPFAPVAQHMLSRAISDAPGLGGRRWQAAKTRLFEFLLAREDTETAGRAARQISVVEEWIEGQRHDPIAGAPKEAVLAAITRVRELARVRLAIGDADPILAVGMEMCVQLEEILRDDLRSSFDLVTMRQLVDAVSDVGAAVELSREEAGRFDHADHPGALLCSRDLVVWWHFVGSASPVPAYAPWYRSELEALARIGVEPPDPGTTLTEESRDCRRAVLSARERLVLVIPESAAGDPMTPHPFWDEIVARLRASSSGLARITVSFQDLLSGQSPPVEILSPLPLPAARPSWFVPAGVIPSATQYSAASIERLLECPLRWVLESAGGLRGGQVGTVPEGALLNGKLGHSLVQRLFESGGLTLSGTQLADAADAILAALLPEEAAPLLQPGLAFELAQLRGQLVGSIAGMALVLQRAGLRVVGVEEEISVPWLGAEIGGRLDVRLESANGRQLVLDLKWGQGSYKTRLKEGRAVQLAVYAHALRQGAPDDAVAAGYFSLSRGALLTTEPEAFGLRHGIEGPRTHDAIRQIANTVPLVAAALSRGEVPVTGVRRSLPLLETLRVDDAARTDHFDAETGRGCEYCGFAVLCGRAWEALA